MSLKFVCFVPKTARIYNFSPNWERNGIATGCATFDQDHAHFPRKGRLDPS